MQFHVFNVISVLVTHMQLLLCIVSITAVIGDDRTIIASKVNQYILSFINTIIIIILLNILTIVTVAIHFILFIAVISRNATINYTIFIFLYIFIDCLVQQVHLSWISLLLLLLLLLFWLLFLLLILLLFLLSIL